ncbi:YcxB family protein [Psychroserpens luteolus]|uniref:YcxB family protein n=1 Tax=Psychroserpens luteolus TaxID=2855840 RepID=UPI001E320D2D|nr:YcxB family protein [Psychroserpens luteolus]MCD2258729.1 YcxB family protein [Psychroserpens luteolus]
MTLHYTLNFDDFLEYQLYASSKSKQHKKNRNKSRLVIPIIYVILGLVMFFLKRTELAILFILFALLWYIFYPLYSKGRYKRHFENHIKEHYKNRIGKENVLTFGDDTDFIETSDFGSQSRIQDSEFDKLIELKEHYFLKLKSELSLIIPKRAVTDHDKFKKLFTDIDLDYVNELDWEWK